MNTPISELARAAQAVTAAPPAPANDKAERIAEAVREALSCAASGSAQRSCSLFDEVAKAAGEPLLLDLPSVLAVHQPWFGVSASDLTLELIEQGFLPCWLEQDQPLPAPKGSAGSGPIPTTAEDLRNLRYEGISLWEVARYDFCVRHELSLVEAERTLLERSDDLLREYARALALIDRAARYMDVFQPKCALIAQGHIMASAVVRAVAQARGIRVIALENTFHSERLLWDDDAALPVVASRAKAVWLREGSRVSDTQAEAYVADFFARAKLLKSAEHASPQGMPPWPASDGRGRIVLLGQVATDAAVLFGLRRGFNRQLDVIRCVASYADRHGHALVVKLHPKEATGQSPLATPYRRLSERQLRADPVLAELLERGTFTLDADNSIDTDRLTDGADVCVAVNSQAGLEALVRGREVVLCGEAFYGHLGLTHEAEDPASLEVALGRALHEDSKRNRGSEAKRFFYTYLEKLCLPKTQSVMAELCARQPA